MTTQQIKAPGEGTAKRRGGGKGASFWNLKKSFGSMVLLAMECLENGISIVIKFVSVKSSLSPQT